MRKPIAAVASGSLALLSLIAEPNAQTPGPSPYAGGDPAAGRRFALEACASCHVVAPDQRPPSRPGRAPDFRAIANMRATTATSLAAFMRSSHPTMPNIVLSDDEMRDVISYILSLRDRS